MNELSGITSAINLAAKINKRLDLDNPMMRIVNAQQDMWDRLMPNKNLFTNHLSASLADTVFGFHDPGGIVAMSQSIQKQFRINIPESTLATIDLISKQHRDLFGISNAMTEIFRMGTATVQMNNMQSALKNISGQITAIATLQQRWDLIDDFEEISEQAMEITSGLNAELPLTAEENSSFQELLTFVYSIVKKHKKVGIYSILFVDMVLRIASFHQYYDFLKSRPELATKEDLGKFETKLFLAIQEKLKSEKEYRIINRSCRMYLKPKSKSQVLAVLPNDAEVIVLQIQGRWVYISYIDPKDNLSLTGWVMKKYLNKP
ncbi:SH3 domain-containing protein [Pedobacter sp. V48]|uniref:SH3 domain-containing protein n=1 Tax=Pedobacter sp. V48 TaxID=509635 RepID=UPI0003E5505A|nr:SH3 domain-containing protein [Pedobacter sp. V48]ETZ20183.1 hypothetical protein N824_08195 [Pedobacter sp. V48]